MRCRVIARTRQFCGSRARRAVSNAGAHAGSDVAPEVALIPRTGRSVRAAARLVPRAVDQVRQVFEVGLQRQAQVSAR